MWTKVLISRFSDWDRPIEDTPLHWLSPGAPDISTEPVRDFDTEPRG